MHRVVNKNISKRFNCTILSVPSSWHSKILLKSFSLMHNGINYGIGDRRPVVLLSEVTNTCSIYNPMLHRSYGIPLNLNFQKGDFDRNIQGEIPLSYRYHELPVGSNPHIPHPYHTCVLKGCGNCVDFYQRNLLSLYPIHNVSSHKLFHTDKDFRRDHVQGRRNLKRNIETSYPEWPKQDNFGTPEWPEKFINSPRKTKSATNSGSKCVPAFLDRARENIKAHSEPVIEPSRCVGSVRKSSNACTASKTNEENTVFTSMKIIKKGNAVKNSFGRTEDLNNLPVGNKLTSDSVWTYDKACQGYMATSHKKFQNIIPPREDDRNNLMVAGPNKKYQSKKKIRVLGRKFPNVKKETDKVFEDVQISLNQNKVIKDSEGRDVIAAGHDADNNLIAKLLKPTLSSTSDLPISLDSKLSPSTEIISQFIDAQKGGPSLKDGIPVYFESTFTQEPSKYNQRLTSTKTDGSNSKSSAEVSKEKGSTNVSLATPEKSNKSSTKLQADEGSRTDSIVATADAMTELKASKSNQLVEEFFSSSTTTVRKPSQEKPSPIQTPTVYVEECSPANIMKSDLVEEFGSTEIVEIKKSESESQSVVSIANQKGPKGGEAGFRIVIQPWKNSQSTVSMINLAPNPKEENQASPQDSSLQLDPRNSLITLNLADKKINPQVVSINSSNRHIKINIAPSQPQAITSFENSTFGQLCRSPAKSNYEFSSAPAIPKSFGDIRSAIAMIDMKKSESTLPSTNKAVALVPVESKDTSLTANRDSDLSLGQLKDKIKDCRDTPFVKIVKISPRKDHEYKYYQKCISNQKLKENVLPENVHGKVTAEYFEDRKSKKPIYQYKKNFYSSSPSESQTVYNTKKSSVNSGNSVQKKIEKPPKVQFDLSQKPVSAKSNINEQSKKRKLYPEEKKLFMRNDGTHSKNKTKKRLKSSSSFEDFVEVRDKIEFTKKKITRLPLLTSTETKLKTPQMYSTNLLKQKEHFNRLKKSMSTSSLHVPKIESLKPRQYRSLQYSTSHFFYPLHQDNSNLKKTKIPEIDKESTSGNYEYNPHVRKFPNTRKMNNYIVDKQKLIQPQSRTTASSSETKVFQFNRGRVPQPQACKADLPPQTKPVDLPAQPEPVDIPRQTKTADLPPQTYEVLCSQYKKNDVDYAMRAIMLNEQRIRESNTIFRGVSPSGSSKNQKNLINSLRPKVSKFMNAMKNKLQWNQVCQSGKTTLENIKSELSRLPVFWDSRTSKIGPSESENRSVVDLSQSVILETNIREKNANTVSSAAVDVKEMRVASSPNLKVPSKDRSQVSFQTREKRNTNIRPSLNMQYHIARRKVPTQN